MTEMTEIANMHDFMTPDQLKTLRDPCDLANYSAWRLGFMPVAQNIVKKMHDVHSLRYDALKSQMI